MEKVTHSLSPGARMQQVVELGGLTTRLVNSENTLASHMQSPEGEIPAEVSRGAAVVSHNKGSPALRLNLWDVTGLTLPPTAAGPLIVASPDSTDTPDSSRNNFYLPGKDKHGGVSRLYILRQGWKIRPMCLWQSNFKIYCIEKERFKQHTSLFRITWTHIVT